MIDRYYPTAETTDTLTGKYIEEIACDGNIVLEVGCGHECREFSDKEREKKGYKIIGLDLIESDLKENADVDSKIVADMESIPLKKESIDIVVSNMVFEHLEKPQVVLGEISRILREGGATIITTPNKYGLFSICAQIIPAGVRPKLLRILGDRRESDVFPTFYRANTIKHLDRMLKGLGFRKVKVMLFQPPPYAFVFSRVLCLLVIVFYRIIRKFPIFDFLRGVIIATYVKR